MLESLHQTPIEAQRSNGRACRGPTADLCVLETHRRPAAGVLKTVWLEHDLVQLVRRSGQGQRAYREDRRCRELSGGRAGSNQAVEGSGEKGR
jgi:hypothetical protein